MTRKKALELSKFLVLPLAVSLGLFPLDAIQAQNTNSNSIVFRPVGAPRTTTGGASRGVCTTAQAGSSERPTPVISLIPATDTELTTEAHPTVFVHIPDSAIEKAEFSIWDESVNGLYQTTVSLPGTPGIVSFKLPNSAPPLAIGKRYKWSVAIICNSNERSRDVVVEGWMQRTELNSALSQQLTTAEPLQKAKLYAQNRIWYETLATLAELRQSHPEDASLVLEWQQLLQSVGLNDVSQAPIVNCCQSQN